VSRIASTFEKLARAHRSALIPFVTAGDPSPKSTVPVRLHSVKSPLEKPSWPAVFWKSFLDAGSFFLLWLLVALAAEYRTIPAF